MRLGLHSLCLLFAGHLCLSGQTTRNIGRIDTSAPVELRGTLPPRAQAAFDRGHVDSSLLLPELALLFKPSAQQQADLDHFLIEQQDPSSPDYHRWLTPEEYADRFAVSRSDTKKIENWLTGQGFQISYRARARNWIAFSGTAAQVERTFRTPIHRYQVDGEDHYANASDPFIPAALEGVVAAVRGLHNFRLKPLLRVGSGSGLRPSYTDSFGSHYLAPDDLAAIYNLAPLYNAGINGSGQKLAIVGQTDISMSDLAAFRSIFNLPASAPQLVLYGSDPGISTNDLPEAELDLEWSGAIARNATLLYVYSTDVFTSLQYAIDQNLAPVVSISYGGCESADSGLLDSFRTMVQQGATQGIISLTVLAALRATRLWSATGLGCRV